MSVVLGLVFFISGAAGLIFETLWFRMAGLTFGNSVWASSLVLSSFMGGLAVGNAVAARWGKRFRRPIRGYALLEILVGLLGLVIVLLLPRMPGLLAPVFRPFLDQPSTLNPIRFGLAFMVLCIPTTAMGLTLPLMVKAWTQRFPDFGKALGKLYGVNTIGAMTGAVLGEWLLLPRIGVMGSAVTAAGLNFAAAALALWIDRSHRAEPRPQDDELPARFQLDAFGIRLLLGAMLSGAVLLALEVVWFRFLHLFVLSTTRGFTIMLLVVLFGIGTGGLFSTVWLKRQPQAYKFIAHLAIGAGLLTLWSYIWFEGQPSALSGSRSVAFFDTLWLCVRLMLPVSFVSGLLFTFLGRSVFETHREEAGAVGWVTLFNTLGAAIGALLAGWVLVPGLGVEKSIFALSLTYGVLAFVVPAALLLPRSESKAALPVLALLTVGFMGTLALFPFGLMQNHFVQVATAEYRSEETQIVEFREGLTETVVYLQDYWLGEPFSARLVTNSFSMTATGLRAQRYMRHFAYLPRALHPRIEKALLISYGLGITAKALTEDPEIDRIDVVDISEDIVAMSELVYPDASERPLNDPRVNLFIEDGRFFLMASDERYDLITGEPPPLMIAGVVNLYTQEYFQLMKDRLAEGGYVTYWLPVAHLSPTASRSVVKAFCNVFDDCSMWRGARLELVLVGSRNADQEVRTEHFTRMWKHPETANELRIIGFEVPALLLATFIGDASFLQEFANGSQPLVDNYPYRLSRDIAPREEFNERIAFYIDVVRDDAVANRYRESDFLKKLLPVDLFESGLAFLPYNSLMERSLNTSAGLFFVELDHLLTETALRTAPLWLMGDLNESSRVIESLVRKNVQSAVVHYHLGLRSMANRKYVEAEEHLQKAQSLGDRNLKLYYYRILALGYAGRKEQAYAVIDELTASDPTSLNQDGFWQFCQERFRLDPPSGSSLEVTVPE